MLACAEAHLPGASIGGLAGRPYSGNVATEDEVFLLQGCGFECGIDLPALIDTAQWITGELGRPLASRVGRAGPFAPSGSAT